MILLAIIDSNAEKPVIKQIVHTACDMVNDAVNVLHLAYFKDEI